MTTLHRVRPGALLTVALLLLLPACGDGGGGGQAVRPSRPAAERPAAEEEAAPAEEEETERYSYNSIGKRDPFRSFIAKELVVGSVEGPLGPLQKHEIDMYRLRGIVWNVQAPRALVEDPDGIGHVVDLGTLIGKNWGKVTQIKPEEIIITEEYRDPIENELIINEITMRLPTPEEVGK
jgi:type IV pilus assembly protein PilP